MSDQPARRAYKKAQGEVKDHLLVAYVDGTEPKVAEKIEAGLTKHD